MTKIIAFVPARGGSKSIPLKNLKDFCGKPLIYWILFALNNSNLIDIIFVGTDSKQIKDTVLSFNLSKVNIYDRDPKNATDLASTESVMLEFIEKHQFDEDDLFVLSQATSPLTTTQDIDKAIKQMSLNNADSILSCVNSKRFYWKRNGKPINYDYKYRPRRQDFQGIFMENGAFYINSVQNIIANKCRLSGKIDIYEMAEYTGIEIDEVDDWPIAESLMKKYILSDKKNDFDIQLFFSDVDGTLTDAGMYYSENGDELKKFNTRDGLGFSLLSSMGIKTGLITSENTDIVRKRAEKLKINFLFQNTSGKEKLNAIKSICRKEKIKLSNVAYVGDDLNCKIALESVGLSACPANAADDIKQIPGIIQLKSRGGEGAVREFIDLILKK